MPYSTPKLNKIGFNGDFGPGMDFGDDAKKDGVELQCKRSRNDKGQLREDWDMAHEQTPFEHNDARQDVIDKLNAIYKRQKENAPF